MSRCVRWLPHSCHGTLSRGPININCKEEFVSGALFHKASIYQARHLVLFFVIFGGAYTKVRLLASDIADLVVQITDTLRQI